MLGDVGDKVSIMPVVYPRGTVSVSSLGYFLSVVSSYKPSHLYFPLYILVHHIQEYFKKKRGRKQKYIKPQEGEGRARGAEGANEGDSTSGVVYW